MRSVRSIVSYIVLLLFSPCAFAVEITDRQFNLLLGTGLVLSNEYHEVLGENLDISHGGHGWATLQLGMSWRMTPR